MWTKSIQNTKGVVPLKIEMYVEYAGQKYDSKRLSDVAKEIWKSEGRLVKDLEKLELYCKPEERRCYYVMNDGVTGHFEID